MTLDEVACIVLASGKSRRFGDADKLAAPLSGQPLLSHVLQTVKDVGVGSVFIVSAEDVSREFEWVENQDTDKGQGHSLRLGINAARKAGWNYVMILLGDMPFVKTSYLKGLVVNNIKKQSVISIFESIRMPPALFNSEAMDIIVKQNSIIGARQIFDFIEHKVARLDVESSLDVDTQDDLAAAADILKHRKAENSDC